MFRGLFFGQPRCWGCSNFFFGERLWRRCAIRFADSLGGGVRLSWGLRRQANNCHPLRGFRIGLRMELATLLVGSRASWDEGHSDSPGRDRVARGGGCGFGLVLTRMGFGDLLLWRTALICRVVDVLLAGGGCAVSTRNGHPPVGCGFGLRMELATLLVRLRASWDEGHSDSPGARPGGTGRWHRRIESKLFPLRLRATTGRTRRSWVLLLAGCSVVAGWICLLSGVVRRVRPWALLGIGYER